MEIFIYTFCFVLVVNLVVASWVYYNFRNNK